MVSPYKSIARSGGSRRGYNKATPVGMTVVSPGDSVSPLDSRMTPIRKSLFQKRFITSNRRKKQEETIVHVEKKDNDTRDDVNEMEHLRSANKKKAGQLKILHDRFTHIQKGLGSIDEERNGLVEKVRKLDKEKKFIQKQLELREKEILSLIKRCASQEEKMRESSQLRSSNRNLQKHLDLMTQKMLDDKDELQDRKTFQKKLQDSELERENLRDQLSKVQKEYDSIADTLQECLGNIRLLTEEKHAIEEEKRRERRRSELELEKQRLTHVNNSNLLKEDIHAHENKIHEMEKILQDNMKSNTALRREKAIMSQGQEKEIQEVVQKYERELSDLRIEMNEARKEVNNNRDHAIKDLEEEILFVKEKLKSKNSKIQELETEFSCQMVELMSKQSCLDEAEECKKNLEKKVESMKKLEIEHAALLDFVQILDSNLVDLTTENAYLELEKDELREETDELRKKANILQRQFSSLQNNHKAKEIDFRELLNAEKEELQIELEESLRTSRSEVVSLQTELESRNKWISKIESELNVARQLIVEKEEEIFTVINEIENVRTDLGAELRKARVEVSQFESEMFAKDQKIASIEGQLEGAKDTRDSIEGIEKDCSIEVKNVREEDSVQLKDDASSNEVVLLQQKIQSLSEEKISIEQEVKGSRSLINDRDKQILEIRKMLLTHTERANELSQKLRKKTDEMDLESLKTKFEERIEELEKELSQAQNSRSESVIDLENANLKIEELESKVQDAKFGCSNTEQNDIKKNKENITLLEERIRCQEQEKLVIAEQLREANEIVTDLKSSMEDTKVASMQQEIHSLTLSHVNVSEELEKVRSDLEEARKLFTAKNEIFDQQRSSFEVEKSKLCTIISERDDIILKFQNDTKSTEQKNFIIKGRLTDAKCIIAELEKERKDREIEYFENQKRQNIRQDEIQFAFVESNKRRVELENELVNMKTKFIELTTTMDDREKQLIEADQGLENARREIIEKNENILLGESRYKDSEDMIRSLEGELQTKKDGLLNVNFELESIMKESQEKEVIINSLQVSVKSLEEVIKKSKGEISGQNNVLATLKETAENFKLDQTRTQKDMMEKNNRIKGLEELCKNEKESRMNLNGEISAAKEHVNELQKVKKQIMEELKERKQENHSLEEQLSKVRNTLETLDSTSKIKISKLTDQVTNMTTNLALRDDEIRELRLFELKDAEEVTTSLLKEVTSLKETASHQDQEKAELISQMEALQSQIQELSRNTETNSRQKEKDADSMVKSIDSLQHEKQLLDSRINKLDAMISDRDISIHGLKEAVLRNKMEESNICSERDLLRQTQQELKDTIRSMKEEFQESLARERDISDMKIRNKTSLHKEELEQALSEHEATMEKLQDSEMLLAERNCSRDELRRKESAFESKLKEERCQREFAEDTLKAVKDKYKQAIEVKRNVTELEKENRELKDKIHRQSAYLERKLKKEKTDRILTQKKKRNKDLEIYFNSGKENNCNESPRSISRTPNHKNEKNQSKSLLPPASSLSIGTYSRSKLHPPSSIGRAFSSNKSITSPSASSCRSSETYRDTVQTPGTKIKSNTDDRSATSELSSILRTPKAGDSSTVPDWELE